MAHFRSALPVSCARAASVCAPASSSASVALGRHWAVRHASFFAPSHPLRHQHRERRLLKCV
jgi:hypothetical protein